MRTGLVAARPFSLEELSAVSYQPSANPSDLRFPGVAIQWDFPTDGVNSKPKAEG